jgi:monoamine oxidase
VVRVVEELGLQSFEQHDSGNVLVVDPPGHSARIAPISSVHEGARRLVGGMATLVEALAGRLPADCVHLDHALAAVVRRDEGLELHFVHHDKTAVVHAHRVVLAMPPRLIAEQVRFEPALDDRRLEVMLDTPTWMAAHAKAILLYDRATWRDAGQSGSAFVRHDRAVLGEIFDASDATGAVAALGGFVALRPALRRHFGPSLRALMRRQVSLVFGEPLEEREHVYQDWATEPRTRSRRDLTEPVPNPRDVAYGAVELTCSKWDHRLYFGGSETAAQGGGHIEGALQAARRIAAEIRAQGPSSGGTVRISTAFRDWMTAQAATAFLEYRVRVHRELAAQDCDGVTRRAVLSAVQQVLDDAVVHLDAGETGGSRSKADLPEVECAVLGFLQDFMSKVVAHNRTSCALSNFPDEHRLPREYLQSIHGDLERAWRGFTRRIEGAWSTMTP